MKQHRFRAYSLQWRLTWMLVLATALVWVAVLAMTWRRTAHELSELLDAHLAQTASVLAAQTGHDDDDFTIDPVLHKYQAKVAFQIWHEKELVGKSARAPDQLLMPLGMSGFMDQTISGQHWRVFATQGHESDVWVMVAEQSAARREILMAGLQSAVGPVLIGLPVLALLIGWLVMRGLAPLRLLGHTVATRHAQALQPIRADVSEMSEVQPLVQALNQLFAQVRTHIESERRFTADAAHELRTPIAAIRMQAQVVQGASNEDERTQALQAVLRGCDRATHLVAQLLDLARLDAQSMGDALAPVDVMEPTRQVLAELIPQALQQGGRIDLLGPDRLLLRTDAVRVAVVLRNLVDNALRYSSASPQVQVRWQALPAVLEVQDAGPGMSQSQIQRLGDRFFRADSSREGSGLGWSIIARIAQREGLQVQVDQSPQLGGLRVRLTWPDQAHA